MFYRRSVTAVSILVVASALLTTTPLRAELQWMWESPLPQGNDILGAWGSSASDIFAVGEYGTMLHYDGSEWSIQPTGLQPPERWYHLNAVWGTGPNNVWAVGNAGLILHYNGVSWSTVSSGTTWSLYGIWGTGADDIFAVGEYGTILRFNGASWTAVNHGLTTKHLFAVWGSSASDVIAVGGTGANAGVVLHWKNNSWTTESLPAFHPPLRAVWGTGPDDVYAVGGAWLAGLEGNGTILRYDGIAWFEMHSPSEYYMAGLWGVDADAAFAVGAAGRVMRLEAGLWETTDLGLSDSYHLFAVWGSSASDVWAFGVGGLIWHYDGISWTQDSTGFKDRITSVWGTRPNDLYVIREESNVGGWVTAYVVDHFDGATWTKVCESSKSSPLNAVWGSGSYDVYVVGGTGASAKILHYDGYTCSTVLDSQSTPNFQDMYAVWGTGPDNVYAAGDAYILHYDGNASHTWTEESFPVGRCDFRGLWGSGPNDIYASAESRILHYNGSSWEESLVRTFPDPPINAVRGCGPGNVYAVGDRSTLLHLSGGTWTQDADFIAAFPSYKLEDVWCADPWNLFVFANSHGTIFHYNGFEWSAMFHSSFNLKAGWGNASDEVYAVGSRGKILRYGEAPGPPLIFQDGFESGDTTAWNP
jgi:hypothetical protein